MTHPQPHRYNPNLYVCSLCSEDRRQGKVSTTVIVDIVHIERAGHVDSSVDQVQTLITANSKESMIKHHTMHCCNTLYTL